MSEAGDEHGAVQPLSAIALISLRRGKDLRARALLEDTLVILERYDDPWSRSMSLLLLGHVDLATGDPAGAVRRILAATALMQEIGNRLYLPWCLEGLAGVAAFHGEWALAARLIGSGDAIQAS